VLLSIISAVALISLQSGDTGIVKGTITINGKATSNVVVSVEGLPLENLGSEISGRKSQRPVMEQRDLGFFPNLLAVVANTAVDFPNSDKTWHNVFSTSEAKTFELGLYPPGESRSAVFDKPGVVRVLCNIHPDMEAYIVVKEHPYFAVPDGRGNYQIEAVPLGRYRLEIWRPGLGTRVEYFNLVRKGEVLAIDVNLGK